MLKNFWEKLPTKFSMVQLDEFVVMPNHVHGIIMIRQPRGVAPTNETNGRLHGDTKPGRPHGGNKQRQGRPHGVAPTENITGQQNDVFPTLGDVMDWYKTMTTNAYINGVKSNQWGRFKERFWQRNYFERVIRDDEDLNRIRQYIIDNPTKWGEDENNPNSQPCGAV